MQRSHLTRDASFLSAGPSFFPTLCVNNTTEVNSTYFWTVRKLVNINKALLTTGERFRSSSWRASGVLSDSLSLAAKQNAHQKQLNSATTSILSLLTKTKRFLRSTTQPTFVFSQYEMHESIVSQWTFIWESLHSQDTRPGTPHTDRSSFSAGMDLVMVFLFHSLRNRFDKPKRIIIETPVHA